MAMSLMWALCEMNKDKGPEDMKQIDLDIIAKYYRMWFKSDPFDVGQTTRTAIEMLTHKNSTALYALGVARSHNKFSLSNGSLMRITPMAIWTAQMEAN